MKNIQKTQIIVGGILVLFVLTGVIPTYAQTKTKTVESVECSIDFSAPTLTKNNGFDEILISEARFN